MLETSAFRACRKDSFFRASRVWATLSVALTALAFSPAAYSETELYSGEQFNAKVSALLAGFGVVATGAGTEYKVDDNDTNQGELSYEPQIDLTYDLEGGGTIYSRLSYVAAASWTFDDDPAPYGFVNDGDHKVINEWANVGYRNDWLDISFGAQDFSVGDALLIGDGSLDCGNTFCGRDSGEFFIGTHKAFRDSAILRVNKVPGVDNVRADVFWLEAGSDIFKGRDSQVWGVNLEYAVPEEGLGFLAGGTLGLMYVAVTAADPVSGVTRKGRRYYDLRLEALTLAALPNTRFYGEVILDDGESEDGTVNYDDEYTFYAEVEHSVQDIPWSPVVGYRYFLASDQHDALFYTFKRGWGTWFQGEFAGEWWHNNSNQRTQMVKLVVSPPFSWLKAIHLLGFHHKRANPSEVFANEVNLLAEWWNDTGFYIVGTFAHGDLGSAGRAELSNSDEDFNSFYIYFQQSF